MLTVIAYGHFTLGATGVVGGIAEVGGASVESGRLPWIYISPPYTLPAESWRFRAGRVNVEIAWVIPITEREARFFDAQGAEALEVALESAGLFPDLHARESVPLPDGF